VTFLREHEVVPEPDAPSELAIRDEGDRWVLASAIAGSAEVLVTGDRDLLDLAFQAPDVFVVHIGNFA
jgi:putative PIN family toxin of toxin-antitoxin system